MARTGASCTWVVEARQRWTVFGKMASEFSGISYCEHFSLNREEWNLKIFSQFGKRFLFWTGIKWTLTLLREVLYRKIFFFFLDVLSSIDLLMETHVYI